MQSDYSVTELEAKPTKNLRTLCRQMDIKHVHRDGKKMGVSYARKSELIDLILTAQKSRTSDIYHLETKELETLADKFFHGTHDKYGRWELIGLMEIHMRNLANGDPYATIGDFSRLVSEFRPTIEAVVQRRTQRKIHDLNRNTLLSWKSRVMKAVENLVNATPGGEQKNELKALYQRFYEGVQGAFKNLTAQRVAASKEALKRRHDNAVEIQVAHLIEWAKDRVANLPEKKSAWSEVAIAVMVLTGRRQSEVMCTASFTPTDTNSHLIFSGQLKRHTEDVVPAYEIPVLGESANGVLEAIEWLKSHGKRATTPKEAHNRFSRYLSEKAKLVCGFITSPNPNWWETSDCHGKNRDRRKCHLFRQIYGQVAVGVFYPRVEGMGRKTKSILGEIMGHADTASSLSHAADAYDADVFVIDIDQLS